MCGQIFSQKIYLYKIFNMYLLTLITYDNFVLLDKIMQELFPSSLKASPNYFCINSDEKKSNFLNRENKKIFLINRNKIISTIF